MKIRLPTVEVSEIARRGLASIASPEAGSLATREQVIEHLAELNARTVAEWEAKGRDAVRRAELDAAQRAFEEARARLEEIRKASGEDG